LKRLDLVGKQFGRLTARARLADDGESAYLCDCVCGNHPIVSVRNLRRGATQSCGCLLDEWRKQRKASDETKAIAKSWATYRDRARVRGHKWALTKKAFTALVLLPCTYCGKRRGILTGIDRVNNALGYFQGNVAPCCGWCNAAKMAHSVEEFKQWVLEVYGKIFHV
jgi:hypothetical protein